jgi:hypothetical protein
MRVTACPIGELQQKFPNLGVSSYQRAVVWTPKQKAALIRSILADYPTGAIILNDLSLGSRSGAARLLTHLKSSHDIIDGQQRLTTIYEFLDEPTVYLTEWARVLPRNASLPEGNLIREARTSFDQLRRVLSSPRAKYVPKGTSAKALRLKMAGDACRRLKELEAGKAVADPQFYSLAAALQKLVKAVARKRLVIEELTDIGTSEAEAIYHLINTSGTQLEWWELLWSKPQFVHEDYVSTAPYKTSRDDAVRGLSILYRSHSKLKTGVGQTNDSFWHSMLALGEYVQCRLALRDPRIQTELLPKKERRLSVDGLGFRLVSTLLSHDIGRAAIYAMFDEYGKDTVRSAIDTLFDTADLLLGSPDASSPDFLFFKKYSEFGADPVQAYPLLGLFVSAAKLVAANKASGAGITLSTSDRRCLRGLTEEIFREVVSTSKWAGTGDSRLKEWLDRHFETAPDSSMPSRSGLGGAKEVNPTYKEVQWRKLLHDLSPTGQRRVDRKIASLHFWVQYLFDSQVSGCLPRGVVQYDHIAAFDGSPRSLTTHPLNICAIRAELNRAKGVKSYKRWAPAGVLDHAYRLNSLCDVPVPGIPASASVDFLQWADHASIERLISSRRKVFEYALGPLLREWITSGDRR